MKNIAIINGIDLSPFVLETIFKGKNSLEAVAGYAKSLPGLGSSILLCKPGVKETYGLTRDERPDWTLQDLLAAFKHHAGSADTLFYFFADTPLLDPEISRKMYGNHQKYYADFTFADGYPYGITPEILNPKIINQLIRLQSEANAAIKRDSVFEIIKKEINNFDIETEISPVDLRLLRLNLSSLKKRDFLMLKKLIENGGTSAETVKDLVLSRPELLRTLPAFFNIQIAERCPQACAYCPYPKFTKNITGLKGEMAVSDFAAILDKIGKFCDDAVIGFSLWGDPSSHSRIGDMVHEVLKRDSLDLVIETSGLGWQESTLETIARVGKRMPSWIVSLDAYSKDMYSLLRGEGFEEAQKTKDRLLSLFPGKVHLQAVRMTDNEDDLEHFYLNHKKITENIIIQKYDAFCGFLPDKSVTDLSPLKRFPCWHIVRDVTVLLDGTVTLCREDVARKHVLGNILKDDLEDISRAFEPYFKKHTVSDYPDLCKKCDEYYTYNF